MKTNKAKKIRMNTSNIGYMTQNEDKQSKKIKNEHGQHWVHDTEWWQTKNTYRKLIIKIHLDTSPMRIMVVDCLLQGEYFGPFPFWCCLTSCHQYISYIHDENRCTNNKPYISNKYIYRPMFWLQQGQISRW